MTVSEAKGLRVLEFENTKPKKLVSEQAPSLEILKEVSSKKYYNLKPRWFRHPLFYLVLNLRELGQDCFQYLGRAERLD